MAYNLSTAVLEWHAAGTAEQRLRTGICVKWQPSFFRDDADGVSEETNLNKSHLEQLNPSLLGVDYGSEDDDDDEQDKVIDALEAATLLKDSLDTANELRPKDEEVDDQSVLRLIDSNDAVLDNAEADQLMPVSESDQGNHLSNVTAYLRPTSTNPILGSKSSSQSANGDGDAQTASAKLSISVLAPLREQISYCEGTQLFTDFDCDKDISTVLQDKDVNVQLDLTTLFPDLQPLGLLEVQPGPVPNEGKKKMEKKSDKDDPNKRIEDTTYTKLYPTGRFMHTKPTLLGPLQPSKRWKNGRWLSTEETSIVPDDGSGRIPDDSSNGNFLLLYFGVINNNAT